MAEAMVTPAEAMEEEARAMSLVHWEVEVWLRLRPEAAVKRLQRRLGGRQNYGEKGKCLGGLRGVAGMRQYLPLCMIPLPYLKIA